MAECTRNGRQPGVLGGIAARTQALPIVTGTLLAKRMIPDVDGGFDFSYPVAHVVASKLTSIRLSGTACKQGSSSRPQRAPAGRGPLGEQLCRGRRCSPSGRLSAARGLPAERRGRSAASWRREASLQIWSVSPFPIRVGTLRAPHAATAGPVSTASRAGQLDRHLLAGTAHLYSTNLFTRMAFFCIKGGHFKGHFRRHS